MSERVKAQACVIDKDGLIYGLETVRTASNWDKLFPNDGPHAPSIAITLADCDSPPDEWVHAAREAYYEAPAGHYWSMIAACVAFLAAARAEAEGGR